MPSTPSPGHAAAPSGAGQVTACPAGLDARYEQLRDAVLGRRADAFPLGYAMFTHRGLIGWRRAISELTNTPTSATTSSTPASAPAPTPPAPPTSSTAPSSPSSPAPAGMAAELIAALAAVALAGT